MIAMTLAISQASPADDASRTSTPFGDEDFDATQWAERIDRLIDSAAQRSGVALGPSVSDVLYLRRVSLDLAGRIPTADETEAFTNDPNRRREVRRLLRNHEFEEFWSECWTTTVVGQSDSRRTDRVELKTWLQEQIAKDQPWDRVVADLISAQGQNTLNGPVNFVLHHVDDPVVPIGRIFLGVQLDCARCHDHPDGRWTQDDYQSMRRFFDPMVIRNRGMSDFTLVDRTVGSGARPRFLTGSQPRSTQWRQELAVLVTASRPFARTIAHRVWYQLMGQGIETDPDQTALAAKGEHKELIQTLADAFAAGGYRLRPLVETICTTRAYARTIGVTTEPESDITWTPHPCVKPLSRSQWQRSAAILLGQPPDPESLAVHFPSRRQITREDRFALGRLWDDSPSLESWMQTMAAELPRSPHAPADLIRLAFSREPDLEQLTQLNEVSPDDLLFAILHSNEFCFWH